MKFIENSYLDYISYDDIYSLSNQIDENEFESEVIKIFHSTLVDRFNNKVIDPLSKCLSTSYTKIGNLIENYNELLDSEHNYEICMSEISKVLERNSDTKIDLRNKDMIGINEWCEAGTKIHKNLGIEKTCLYCSNKRDSDNSTIIDNVNKILSNRIEETKNKVNVTIKQTIGEICGIAMELFASEIYQPIFASILSKEVRLLDKFIAEYLSQVIDIDRNIQDNIKIYLECESNKNFDCIKVNESNINENIFKNF
ncbi:hypothetical protein SCLARK_00701 [Spiroplasma clarkii]|uniref:hypothetical protein n=1 Tax=Spiroplasma clarkii TaxID=2139 RepID=UPI000B56EA50|nr:hypothetical protein [Spiroplasma clarkii]ARU91359.1 hypothetical protein SCLARK_00701 [Spiroplasma clarkii]